MHECALRFYYRQQVTAIIGNEYLANEQLRKGELPLVRWHSCSMKGQIFMLSSQNTLFGRFAKLCVGALLFATPLAHSAEYEVDGAHSTVGFSVKHMVISTVTGRFNSFSGTFEFDAEKGTAGNTKFEVKADSIDTGNAKRDEHLKSPDFFDVAKFPMITVTNSKIKKMSKDKYEWNGDLTMHGVTKPVKFDLEYTGTVKDPMGNQKIAFSARTKIKRSEWGLKWNKALEAGGVAVSDDVQLLVDVAAVEKKHK